MSFFIYALAVAFGAAALLIEARRNYNESLRTTPFSRYPILDDAQVSDLCNKRDGFIGFIIYSSLYLVAYAVILSSTELLDLIRSSNLAQIEAGSTNGFDPFGEDLFNLEGTEYGTPIFVSAFLIALLSLDRVRPIENLVRTAAHRLAGIPRGVYRVIELLQSPNFRDISKGNKRGTLASHFYEKVRQLPSDHVDLANHKKSVHNALRAIDALWPSISPAYRAEYFPATELDKLNTLSGKLHEDMKDLRRELIELDPADKDKLAAFDSQARMAANNTRALFAVHYIRNNCCVKNLRPKTLLARICEEIDRNYKPEQNAFAMAALISFFLAAVMIFMVYLGWHTQSVNQYPFGMASSQVETTFEGHPDVSVEQCKASHGNQPFEPPLTATQETICTQLMDSVKQQYVLSIQVDLAAQAFWDALQGAAVAFIAVGFVTFAREIRLEQESWRTDWSFKRIPFLRLLTMCFLPGILVFFCALGMFLTEMLVDSGFNLSHSQILQTVTGNNVYFLMMPLVGMVVSFGALVILDKHNSMSATSTLLISLACVFVVWLVWAAVIMLGYNFPNWSLFPDGFWITIKSRDWLISVILPTLFLPLFGLLLEATEEESILNPEDPDDEAEMEDDSPELKTPDLVAPSNVIFSTGKASRVGAGE